jgi:ACR3 family arsenite efflux pump ArsB
MRWASLLLEFMVLFPLIFGMVAAKIMKDVKGHYKLLAVATVLNIIAVLFLMVPRFWDMAAGHVDHGMDQCAWAVIVHHTLGGFGVILSLILMVQFARARGNMARCPNATARGRLLMRLCLIFLIVPLLMGVGLRLTAL